MTWGQPSLVSPPFKPNDLVQSSPSKLLNYSMEDMTKKTRRPSLTRSLVRSMGGSTRKPAEKIPPPVDTSPALDSTPRIASGGQVHYELPPSTDLHGPAVDDSTTETSRRPSLFHFLRKSFSLSSISSRKSSGSSTVSSSTRKGSGSSQVSTSQRKDSNNSSISSTLRIFSRDRSTLTTASTDCPSPNSKAAAHRVIAAARSQRSASPHLQLPVTSATLEKNNAAIPTDCLAQQPTAAYFVSSVQIVRPGSNSLSSDSDASVYEEEVPSDLEDERCISQKAQDDASDYHSKHVPTAPPRSVAYSTSSATSTEGEEKQAPMWAGFGGQCSGNFINPWSARPISATDSQKARLAPHYPSIDAHRQHRTVQAGIQWVR